MNQRTRIFLIYMCHGMPWVKTMSIWVCLKIVYPEKPNGFADVNDQTIPFLNGYFIGNIPHFQTYPYDLPNISNQMTINGEKIYW